ncbi:hypothetical protein Tco_0517599 [Tanacetum coccineum]
MTTPITTSTTDSQMHNNIMAAGSKDRPPMLATGRYAQWRSRFLRYIDTRPNGDALRKCILKGPYTPTIVTTPAVPATEDSPAVPEQTTVETNEIYSTVDACPDSQEMVEAIERCYNKVSSRATGPDTDLKLQRNLVIMLRNAESQMVKDHATETVNEEIEEQELEAHYSYMAKRQEKIVDQAWVKHSNDLLHLRNPTAQDMEILVKTCLMPLALKTQNDSFAFVHELKQEMHADLKYVESLEDEIDELESDKAEFSNMYDMLLQECVSKDVNVS